MYNSCSELPSSSDSIEASHASDMIHGAVQEKNHSYFFWVRKMNYNLSIHLNIFFYEAFRRYAVNKLTSERFLLVEVTVSSLRCK
uniref:Uncharacterized protein n=1 Tax=Arundo donax TaxID=35708 RepID=A0A0A8ZDN8_ARUDO